MEKIPVLITVMVLVSVAVDAVTSGTPQEDQQSQPDESNRHKLMLKIMDSDHKKADPPSLESATEVQVGFYISSMTPRYDTSGVFTVTMDYFLRQSWIDARLAFDPDNDAEVKVRADDSIGDVWIPDVFFRNGVSFTTNREILASNVMRIYGNGKVWYVRQMRGTFSCPEKLQKYPFDTQHCPLMIESFGYTMDTMYFAWLKSPVDITPDFLYLRGYTLQDQILYDCSQNYSAGAFPCLEIRFVLRRHSGYHVVQLFLPAMLIVAISWLVFWVRLDAIQTRVILGLLTVVTMTTVAVVSFVFMPRSSYVKAVDVWLATCVAFVLAALLAVFTLEFMYHRNSPEAEIGTEKEGKDDPMTSLEMTPQPRGTEDKKRGLAQQINKYSRVGFPLLFLLFNIIYWVIYHLPGTAKG